MDSHLIPPSLACLAELGKRSPPLSGHTYLCWRFLRSIDRFLGFLVAQDVVFRIVGLLLFFSIALWHLFIEERATRKLIKLNRYSEFLETQRQRVKKPIPFKVGFPLGCALLMRACILYVFDLTVEPLFAARAKT
jgi:hypothetical protein